MTPEALQAVQSATAAVQAPFDMPPLPNPVGTHETGAFASIVSNGIAQVDRQLAASEVDLQQLAVGNTENLHQIMMKLEESKLSFQLLLQVRNRLLEGYQDIMRMQI